MFNQDIVTAINVRKNHFKIYCLKKKSNKIQDNSDTSQAVVNSRENSLMKLWKKKPNVCAVKVQVFVT